jgi:nitrogen-specific signal transduction histidine kinase/CheY-like chemotaxis protein
MEDNEKKKVHMNTAAEVLRGGVTPLNYNGIKYQHQGTVPAGFEEIKKQNKIQHMALQTQKIQSLSTFAGSIAHDLNNILGVILAYASRIELNRTETEDYSKNLKAINTAVDQGTALVQQILTFAGKTDSNFKPTSIPHLVGNLVHMFKQTFPTSIRFQEDVDWNIPEINADQHQIHQILSNLCLNALDAMPQGGVITIKVNEIAKKDIQEKYPMIDQERYVCISVSDSGRGIDETIKDRIYDPFFTTKQEKKGKGLGLSVVYGIVQSHHGFIDLESEPDSGSTFSLYFPTLLPKQQKEGVAYIDKKGIEATAESILVVEDERGLLELARIMLESAGYKIYTAKDGIEAVEVYKQHQEEIALVFTDIGLPGLNGREVFAKLKEMNPNVQVIFTSGIFTDIKAELLKDGAKDFIQKPYKQKDVLQKMREVLDAQKIHLQKHISN